MIEKYISIVGHGQTDNGLYYLIIEHSGIAPCELLGQIIRKEGLGILLLGIDGPHLLSNEVAQRLLNGFRQEGVDTIAEGTFLWISCNDAPKLIEKEWFSCEGDAFLLKPSRPDHAPDLSCLPKPSKDDSIDSETERTLGDFLKCKAVYVHDDFSDCFIVTKDRAMFRLISEKAEQIAGPSESSSPGRE